MATSVPLEHAIVQSIQEISEKYSLNCSNIRTEFEKIVWNSDIESLGGIVQFSIPRAPFEKSLEEGMENVSILVAFAELISKDENQGMSTNMKRARQLGAPYYYTVNPTHTVVQIYLPSNSYLALEPFKTLNISFTRDDTTGEYTWTIPDLEEVYCDISGSIPDFTSVDMERQVSLYTGLVVRRSSGIPVMEATHSVQRSISEPSVDG